VLGTLAGEERMDTVLEPGAHTGQPDVVAKKLSQLAKLRRRHVRLRKQIGAQQMSERARVDSVGLHPRGDDRLRMARVGQVELDPLGIEEVCEPLPAEGRLERHPRLPSQLREDGTQRLRVVRDPTREQLQALLVEGSHVRGPAVEVDADVDHGGLLSDPELTASA
jgi:hypothetical protein